MKNLLISPSKMSLSSNESVIYQSALTQATELSLNLMAVKVEQHPNDFNGWCLELTDVCRHRINRDLLDDHQNKPLKKLTELLMLGVSVSQIRMAGIAPWPLYVGFLNQQAANHAFDERRRLLEYIANLRTSRLSDMINEDRLTFAGKHSTSHDPLVFNFDSEWFGSTKTAKAFHSILSNDPESIDRALSHVPLEGEVSKDNYQAFVTDYVQAFDKVNEKPTLWPATRLLAMRRPDQFVAISSSKIDPLCQGLGIKRLNNSDFSHYWSELIGAVRQMRWWQAPKTEDDDELFFWNNRVALIDMLFYADETTGHKSNYLKMLNKPVRATASRTSTRRSKESAAALVDRVLANEDVPDYVKAQRDSIVTQVESGKKIDDVLSLLRKIFG